MTVDILPDARSPFVRLSGLLDPGSVVPLHPADDSGVVAASGSVDGVPVYAYCTDATRMAGALGARGADHIVAAIEAGRRDGHAVLGIWHSGGARLADGVDSMDGMARMFAAMTAASGRVPQISVIVGPAAGAAAYGPALTDVVVMADTGRMLVTGPDVIRSVTGEQVDIVTLGGPATHSRKSGVAHVVTGSEADAYDQARRLTKLLATPGQFETALVDEPKDLLALLPDSPRRAYDVRPLVRALVDSFCELQPHWAANIVIGLGRFAGRTVGVVANNPLRKGGCLDSLSAEKASRFVRMCNALGIPLVVLVDVPGYLPGVNQEWGGVIRRGAKLLHAFAEAVVPRVTLVTRKAYGGAYIAMNGRGLGATAVYAWPQAEIAVMGAEAAVEVVHRRKLAAAAPDDLPALRSKLMDEHNRISGGVTRALSLGVVDAVIEPADTRRWLAKSLADAPARRGEHSNIPL
ncbi:acyl-CoA carboxylase subunit beta [Paractinoplanes hotanensis]|uniref:Acyl-CoA carboxylase subunit beta n=1 Tax=Paractinoplanes hotanensis TaxID=2906497 RepID=A0ABT0YG73_9ACTN|nr:carboxyl transferase domain-containing protein [Actinoplanes hotanensis]MCM4085071.1 acyl-CoA carboxylase subunit beta [Actinoplanes hotanensis]